jgi:hypothetical protein
MSDDEIGRRYQDRWVAVMDIIGYRERVRRAMESDTAADEIRRLRVAFELMSMAGPWFPEAFTGPIPLDGPKARQLPGHDDTARIISDTVYATALKDHEYTLVQFLQFLGRMILSLTTQGVFLRGAVTCGYHFDDEEVLFSQPFIQAYDMESNEAFYPRVVLSREVTEAFERFAGFAVRHDDNEAWRDTDGRLFINYLGAHNMPPEFLGLHKAKVEEALAEARGNPRHTAKHLWTAGYHNAFCRRALQDSALDDMLIPDVPDTGPGPLSPSAQSA